MLDAQHIYMLCLLGSGLSRGNGENLMAEQRPWEARASCQSQLPEEEKRAGAGLLEEVISALNFVV